ncbi:hypothetical protein AB0I81_23975 [Nonomuraea sp. NPDC050404]|uniref:hypothetical protein n=1 Tax=Nonomuraea sp. NPDC050404 TaxID=3155783 RepID=UPI0033E466A3
MNTTSRSNRWGQALRQRRTRVVAVAGILAVLTGGGSLLAGNAIAAPEPCDAETELCADEPTTEPSTFAAVPAEPQAESAQSEEEAAGFVDGVRLVEDPEETVTGPEAAGTEAAGTEAAVTEEETSQEEATEEEAAEEPATEAPVTEGEAAQDAGPLIREAIDEAKRMLTSSTDCENKVTGKSRFKASVILSTLDTNNRLKDATNRSKTKFGKVVAAEAVRQGDGSNGTITFYAGFLLPSTTSTVTDEESRVLTLLHELGHLTGSLSASEADVPQWEDDVKRLCIVPARSTK